MCYSLTFSSFLRDKVSLPALKGLVANPVYGRKFTWLIYAIPQNSDSVIITIQIYFTIKITFESWRDIYISTRHRFIKLILLLFPSPTVEANGAENWQNGFIPESVFLWELKNYLLHPRDNKWEKEKIRVSKHTDRNVTLKKTHRPAFLKI